MEDRRCGHQCGCHRTGLGPAALAVDLSDETGKLTTNDQTGLSDLLRRAGAELDASGEIRLRVVDDAVMADLHRRHSGIPGTTDVLTFDLRPMGLGPLDTDIVVCWDEAVRQASARGHSPQRELLLYGLHGILHCMGHDDHDELAYARMHAAEDAVLTAIGVGPVFAKPATEGGAS
jgi:probable rRNA maturation factor